MPEIFDGQEASLTVDGIAVGGIDLYRFFEGQPRVIPHRALAKATTEYAVPVPDYGTAVLTLFRNHSDPGQQRLAQSQAQRAKMDCVLTLNDGSPAKTFKAHCESLPLIGGKRNGQTIQTSQARLRISGLVT